MFDHSDFPYDENFAEKFIACAEKFGWTWGFKPINKAQVEGTRASLITEVIMASHRKSPKEDFHVSASTGRIHVVALWYAKSMTKQTFITVDIT
jgi:hypothetical protein